MLTLEDINDLPDYVMKIQLTDTAKKIYEFTQALLLQGKDSTEPGSQDSSENANKIALLQNKADEYLLLNHIEWRFLPHYFDALKHFGHRLSDYRLIGGQPILHLLVLKFKQREHARADFKKLVREYQLEINAKSWPVADDLFDLDPLKKTNESAGETALHVAAQHNPYLIPTLLELGANAGAARLDGANALQLLTQYPDQISRRLWVPLLKTTPTQRYDIFGNSLASLTPSCRHVELYSELNKIKPAFKHNNTNIFGTHKPERPSDQRHWLQTFFSSQNMNQYITLTGSEFKLFFGLEHLYVYIECEFHDKKTFTLNAIVIEQSPDLEDLCFNIVIEKNEATTKILHIDPIGCSDIITLQYSDNLLALTAHLNATLYLCEDSYCQLGFYEPHTILYIASVISTLGITEVLKRFDSSSHTSIKYIENLDPQISAAMDDPEDLEVYLQANPGDEVIQQILENASTLSEFRYNSFIHNFWQSIWAQMKKLDPKKVTSYDLHGMEDIVDDDRITFLGIENGRSSYQANSIPPLATLIPKETAAIDHKTGFFAGAGGKQNGNPSSIVPTPKSPTRS